MSKYTVTEIGDALVVRGAGEPLDLWNELRRYYVNTRPVQRGPGGLRYPETTHRDVRAVIAILSRELGRTSPTVAGYDREAKAWARAAETALDRMRGLGADDTFAENLGFWLGDARHLAVYLSVARHLPTRDELAADFAELTRRAP